MSAETIQQRAERFSRSLAGPMADQAWGLDLAQRLLAYDPEASAIAGIEFETGDRIVVLYRTGRAAMRRSFVVPKWAPPVVEQAA